VKRDKDDGTATQWEVGVVLTLISISFPIVIRGGSIRDLPFSYRVSKTAATLFVSL